jgi:hypothetical protein
MSVTALSATTSATATFSPGPAESRRSTFMKMRRA